MCIRDRINKVENPTEIKEMFKNRVTPIIRHFLATDELFESLEESKMIELMLDVFMQNCSLEELQTMDEETLTRKIRRILGGRVMFGLLSDLTPEEMAIYEQTVKELRNW